MVSIIKMGRAWEINTKEDYDHALEVLEGNKFCAWMSDDFSYWQRELAEYDRQMAEVMRQAKEKGII